MQGAVLGLQLLGLSLAVSVFTVGLVQFWTCLVGLACALSAGVLRAGPLMRPRGGSWPGPTIVGTIGLGLLATFVLLSLAIPPVKPGPEPFWTTSPLGLIPTVGGVVMCLFVGQAAQVTSRWVEDHLSTGFFQYAIWPFVLPALVAIFMWLMGVGDRAVTALAIGALGWWLIQSIGDLLLLIFLLHSILHRVQADARERRRRDRESEWTDDLPRPHDH